MLVSLLGEGRGRGLTEEGSGDSDLHPPARISPGVGDQDEDDERGDGLEDRDEGERESAGQGVVGESDNCGRHFDVVLLVIVSVLAVPLILELEI